MSPVPSRPVPVSAASAVWQRMVFDVNIPAGFDKLRDGGAAFTWLHPPQRVLNDTMLKVPNPTVFTNYRRMITLI